MAKNKRRDAGLEHVLQLGISAFKNDKDIVNELSRKYGQKEGARLAQELLEDVEEGGRVSYEKKNRDYDLAMLLSGGYDANIVRAACNWLAKNKIAFGQNILEIGCDCGFMTCFMAAMFPERHFVTIDRNNAAIEIARKNSLKFGLKNIDFICIEAADLPAGKFDTVISMRTLFENSDRENIREHCEQLMVQAGAYAEKFDAYAKLLSRLVKEEGTIITLEQMGTDAAFLGWLKSLHDSDFGVNFVSCKQLTVQENEKDVPYQALVAYKGKTNQWEDLYAFWESGLGIAPGESVFHGWAADALVQNSCCGVIEGYFITDKDNNDVGKGAIYETEYPETVMYYFYNGEERFLGVYDRAGLDQIRTDLQEKIETNRKIGFLEVPFTMQDGKEQRQDLADLLAGTEKE